MKNNSSKCIRTLHFANSWRKIFLFWSTILVSLQHKRTVLSLANFRAIAENNRVKPDNELARVTTLRCRNLVIAVFLRCHNSVTCFSLIGTRTKLCPMRGSRKFRRGGGGGGVQVSLTKKSSDNVSFSFF